MKTLLPYKRINRPALGCLLVALLFSNGLPVQAQPNPDKPARPRPPAGERQRDDRPDPRMQPGPGLAQMERVLTEDQRESMRSIMASQRETMRDTNEKMRVARKDLLKAALAESFDEDVVRSKALAVAKLEAELTVLRAKALSQVQPPLSEDQIEQIMNPPPNRMPDGGDPRRGDRPPRPRPPQPGPQ